MECLFNGNDAINRSRAVDAMVAMEAERHLFFRPSPFFLEFKLRRKTHQSTASAPANAAAAAGGALLPSFSLSCFLFFYTAVALNLLHLVRLLAATRNSFSSATNKWIKTTSE